MWSWLRSSATPRPRSGSGSGAWGRRAPAAPARPPPWSGWCESASASVTGRRRAARRQARRGGAPRLARVHDRARRRLPRRSLAGAPRSPRVRNLRRRSGPGRTCAPTSQRVQSLRRPTCSSASNDSRPRASAAGADAISLGIGDPDLPTPPHIIHALTKGAADRRRRPYPSNLAGETAYRERWPDSLHRRPSGVDLDPASRSSRWLGAEEGITAVGLALLTRATWLWPADRRLPGLRHRPRAGRRRSCAAAPDP